jgi:hypothetical protein
MDVIVNLDDWFVSQLSELRCTDDTKAYVTGVLTKFKCNTQGDMSHESIVLAFNDARISGDFKSYQRIGDWVLFIDVIVPDAIKHHRKSVETIGQLSYSSCHKLMLGRWLVFEELAERLPGLSREARSRLRTTVVKRPSGVIVP